jgi:acyl-CoA synthetase (AMP-forming)/AMP-acid ligase II
LPKTAANVRIEDKKVKKMGAQDFLKAGGLHLPALKRKLSLRELLIFRCENYGEKIFLLDPEKDIQYTYAEFLEKVNAVSNLLFKMGIRKNDKVSLLMPNSAEYLFAFFGIMQLGAVACPLNTGLKVEEVAYILDNSDSTALFTTQEFLAFSAAFLKSQNKIRSILAWDGSAAAYGKELSLQGANLETALEKESLRLLPGILDIPLQADDVAEIIYTSGTTGKPKGAMLSHHNLIIDAYWVAAWNRLQESDRALCVMPLFHVNGQIVTVMSPLYHGGSVVMPHRFSVTGFFNLIAAYGVTYVGTVATMLSMLLNRVDPRDILQNELKIVFCGSAPVPVKVQAEFEKTFQVPVIEGYGMTETTCRATFNPLPPPEALKLGENDGYRKLGSVGLPLGNEIKIVDAENNPLGPGELGEIVIRGENIMRGYYKNPQATAEAFTGDWFHSGDLGYFDEDGYFYIVDRKTDMIIRGGENIYPREIEEILYKHPAVRDAACIGIPDDLYGEEVAAAVAVKDHGEATAEELIAFCRQHLADFKCPQTVRIVEEIPKSSSGKLLRRELRAQWDSL